MNGEHRTIVVTGAGRSGTSLAMSLLAECGVRVSDQLIPASEQNPQGTFEDAEILRTQRELVKLLFRHQMVPRPGEWVSVKEIHAHIDSLRRIMSRYIECSTLPWAFKDPQTTMLIPIWIRLFNEQRITPQYVFCTRTPSSIIESMCRQYGSDPKRSELVWYLRNIWFLNHVGCRAYILHYEDWFRKPKETLIALSAFLGVGGPRSEAHLAEILDRNIKLDLYRVRRGHSLTMKASKTLGRLLGGANGYDFDRTKLQRFVEDACKSYLGFEPLFRLFYDERVNDQPDSSGNGVR